jgi:hypothetical protein
MDSDVVKIAATRFERAWAMALKDRAERFSPTDTEMVEVHEAALELVGATGTNTLQDALQVLRKLDV